MMLGQLLATLRDLNVHLYVEDGNLKCKAPKDALNEEIRYQLKSRKAELIDILDQSGIAQSGEVRTSPIKPGERIEPIPLSYAQQRLWFLDQLEPDSALYNMPAVFKLTGCLNEAALAQSFNEIVRRHENLRTVFVTVKGVPTQAILPASEWSVAQVDLTALPEHSRPAVLRDLCRREAEKTFSLATGPLLRITLIALSSAAGRQQSILLVTLHHIVSDGWSSSILLREFATLYQAFSAGQCSPLAELPVQYADFACWQRRYLGADVLRQQGEYWRNRLAGAPSVLELPTDYPRPAVMAYCGAQQTFAIPAALAKQIRTISRQYDVTLFMLLLASFDVLLFRFSGQADICVGTPVANRNRLEIEGLIGFFVNTLVMRCDLSGNPRFDELLIRVRSAVLDAQSHQDLPFEQLVETLHPERNLSHSPLFQVMLVLQNQAGLTTTLAGLDIRAIDDESTVAKFDLTLQIHEDRGGLTGSFEYNTALFEAATMARFAACYLELLQGIADAPQCRLSELPLLPSDARSQLLFAWNATAADYPRNQCLHQLFEAQVEKTPLADALAFAGQTLSYAELNARANQLAHYLRAMGVVPDRPVGLCVGRSLEMAVGMLGILKAGGAYLPLDPLYPEARIASMLDDAGVGVLLTGQAWAALGSQHVGETICLDSDWPTIAQWSVANPAHCNHPLDLAYMIYTSGSTGTPKGVMVSHRNAVHSTTARFIHYQEPVSAYLLLSSFAFDSSVAGLFWTLGQGGCLCLPTDDAARDPVALAELIAERRVSHLLALPSFYAVLLKQAGASLQSLKTAIVAGETCATEIVRLHREIAPQVHLYNEYGPTEGSVWSSVYRAGQDDLHKPLPIGRPIPNVRLYILDRSGSPVPVGVQGELHIGGEGVVRGYWRRPELTAEKFIPDTFRADGGRLYKTGDLARYRPDGDIEFLGRIDHQVKIRGFRIELGEIEARLMAHPAVDEALVSVREDQPGNRQLVAYVVGNASTDGLRSYLQAALPDYMVPGAFVLLERMPLTANGKLDRQALPTPDSGEAAKDRYAAPVTETEKILAAIWSEILGIDSIGRHDDFFDSGGHSLLATQLPMAVQKKFNIRLPLKRFFEIPVLAEQARLIDAGEGDVTVIDLNAEAAIDPGLVPLDSGPVDVAAAQSLFLTGATGFLGVYLLAELLGQTRADIYCLIRAADEREALLRLQRQTAYYGLQDVVDWRRVIAVCGDLAEPRLGLSELRYHEIAAQADAIYHNGALVNFIRPYQALKAANVGGTEAVLRLACSGKAKAIHYVSTLSVFSEASADNARGFQEKDEPLVSENLTNGYAQSKWVAEKMVRLAGDRGFQVTVYRPATVSGDSRSGRWNTDDFLCRMLKGCIQMGYAPVESVPMDMASVDYVSRAIVALSLQPDAIGRCFHLNHPSPPYSGELIDWFSRSGYRMDRLPYQDWMKKVRETGASDDKDFALLPVLSMFSEPDSDDQGEASEENPIRYDCSATQAVLSRLGIDCPVLDGAVLTRYQAYFEDSGFVRKPERHCH